MFSITLFYGKIAGKSITFEIMQGPFDEDSWFDIVLNWLATGFLWCIYFFLVVLALAITYAILASRHIASWIGIFFLAFCYTIIFGRWWDYDYAFIAFSIIFVLTKLLLGSFTVNPKMKQWFEKIFTGKDDRDKRKRAPDKL